MKKKENSMSQMTRFQIGVRSNGYSIDLAQFSFYYTAQVIFHISQKPYKQLAQIKI